MNHSHNESVYVDLENRIRAMSEKIEKFNQLGVMDDDDADSDDLTHFTGLEQTLLDECDDQYATEISKHSPERAEDLQVRIRAFTGKINCYHRFVEMAKSTDKKLPASVIENSPSKDLECRIHTMIQKMEKFNQLGEHEMDEESDNVKHCACLRQTLLDECDARYKTMMSEHSLEGTGVEDLQVRIKALVAKLNHYNQCVKIAESTMKHLPSIIVNNNDYSLNTRLTEMGIIGLTDSESTTGFTHNSPDSSPDLCSNGGELPNCSGEILLPTVEKCHSGSIEYLGSRKQIRSDDNDCSDNDRSDNNDDYPNDDYMYPNDDYPNDDCSDDDDYPNDDCSDDDYPNSDDGGSASDDYPNDDCSYDGRSDDDYPNYDCSDDDCSDDGGSASDDDHSEDDHDDQSNEGEISPMKYYSQSIECLDDGEISPVKCHSQSIECLDARKQEGPSGSKACKGQFKFFKEDHDSERGRFINAEKECIDSKFKKTYHSDEFTYKGRPHFRELKKESYPQDDRKFRNDSTKDIRKLYTAKEGRKTPTDIKRHTVSKDENQQSTNPWFKSSKDNKEQSSKPLYPFLKKHSGGPKGVIHITGKTKRHKACAEDYRIDQQSEIKGGNHVSVEPTKTSLDQWPGSKIKGNSASIGHESATKTGHLQSGYYSQQPSESPEINESSHHKSTEEHQSKKDKIQYKWLRHSLFHPNILQKMT